MKNQFTTNKSKSRKEQQLVQVAAKIPGEQREYIEDVATSERRSSSQVIRILLEEAIEARKSQTV
jgi:hypothetical protein